MPDASADELTKLRAQLAEVTRREAKYRLESVQDYLDLQARLRSLSATIGERGTYIHQLHLDELARKGELEAATADLEALVWMLQAAETAREKSEHHTPAGWLRALLGQGRTPAEPKVPPGNFVYHLTTSPFRLYRGASFTLHGWVFPRDGRPVTAIRVRLAGREFAATLGLPAPKAIAQHGALLKNPQPGFEVTFDTPPGRHRLALEAQLEDGKWRSILNVPVWCRPAN